ncbi:Receptor-type tyrosine-protein phosphatase mu, partial [Armadillidium nasatum]
SVPKDCGKPCTVATHIMNKMKNRYINNLPYDDTRVVLSLLDKDPYSDYINASLMNLKVGEYFREGEVLEFGGIYVAVLERLQHPHFIRSVIQYTRPEDYCKRSGITIHCSAGIGRTGTVLLVLLLKEFQEASTWIDPISVLRNMRETRAGLVENIQQFNLSLLLLYECIYGKLGSVYTNENDTNWDNNLIECSKLFERLMKQPILHTYSFGENNIDFNRNPAILPSDNQVIFYGKKGTGKNSDYLNSISIDIEDMLNSIIVTEHPLPSTLYNFWKMLFAKKCSYLCMLNFIEPSEDFPSVLPLEEGAFDFGSLAIHVASTEGPAHFVSSQYVVTLSSRESSHSVNVIQLLDWKPEEEYPASLSQLEGIVSFVKEKANSKAPVVLCCSDGVTACGLVTAAVNVVNRIDVYQELNIYNSVLRIRRCRPEFLTSKV